jgi:hypothetical protein
MLNYHHDADPFPISEMYRLDKNGNLCSIRGTSQNENWNGRLGGVMNGSNNSPALAQCLFSLYIGRGNMDATARLAGGSTHYGNYELHQMQRVNKQAAEVGFVEPYPNLPKVHPKIAEPNPLVPLPKLGYNWDQGKADNKEQPQPARRVFEKTMESAAGGVRAVLTCC